MKHLRRFLLITALALVLSATALAATGVTTGTAAVGGATAQVVYIDMVDGRSIIPAIAGDSIHTDAPASDVIATVDNGAVVAAINGGFFDSYYNAGAPLSMVSGNYPRVYSTVVSEGYPLCAGGSIAAIGMDYSGNVYIDRVTLNPNITLRGNLAVTAWGVNNTYSDPSSVYILTDDLDYAVDIPANFTKVEIRNNVVASISAGASGYRVADGVTVLVYGPTAYANAAQWQNEPVVGDSAVLDYAATPSNSANTAVWNNMRTVMAGGGMLVQNGQNAAYTNVSVTAADQDPDVVGLRTFVALMNDGRLMLGAVSSSFGKMADSLIAMGVKDAIYMDGGASTMLYANGSYLTSAGRRLATVLTVVDETGGGAVKPVDPSEVVNPSDQPSSWAVSAVESARANNILPEHLDGQFKRNITRKEFCDLIARYFRAETGSSIEYYCSLNGYSVNTGLFSDCDSYYVPYVAALGIVTGDPGGIFRPNDPILRQDAAIILQRLANVIGAGQGGAVKQFTDAADISGYAKPGVDFCTSLGIMQGNGDTFTPRDNITREQAVITIMNAYSVLDYTE